MKLIKLALLPPVLFCAGCTKYTKTNAEEYVEILQEARSEQDFHTELYIFPETIDGAEIKAFYYAHMDDLFTGSFLLYVVLAYDEETYSAELERIKSLKADFGDEKIKKPIEFPEKNLILTVYQNVRFEYVIYEESTHEIAYISNQIFDWKETPVDEKYVVPEITIPAEIDDRENMYNMYYWCEGDVGIYIKD